jgi:hypothetical protein
MQASPPTELLRGNTFPTWPLLPSSRDHALRLTSPMIQVLRGTPEQVLWRATLVLHALAPTACAELGKAGAVIELSVMDETGAVTRESVRRHAAALKHAASGMRHVHGPQSIVATILMRANSLVRTSTSA